ncbi:MAG: N-acetylmuramoyl-L-alanine amidase [bacterium]|nr:N-acetylmuramoyl-L-alanine amidase [bacterium]
MYFPLPLAKIFRVGAATLGLLGIITVAVRFGPNIINNTEPTRTLVSSLGQHFTTQSEHTEIDETLSASPGLTLTNTGGVYADARHVESEIYSTDRPFSAFGVRWHAAEPAGTSLTLAVRAGSQTGWGAWQSLQVSEDAFAVDDATARISDLLFVDPSTRIQFSVDLVTQDSGRTPRLEQIRFDFMDPNPGPKAPEPTEETLQAASPTSNQPAVISRTQWGANEALMNWAPQYATVKQIIVHHTAGGDGGTDPAAAIRGIYQYHAQTLGWGDIGYNFLIDPQGRIYEGRKGGWNAIGAHTLGYNTGSIGIALLGTYQSTPASSQAEQALTQLSAFISAKYDLDPTQMHTFIDTEGPTLAGHRDFGQTLCPGSTEYARLGSVRSAALAARASYYGGSYSGAVVSVSGSILPLNTAGTAIVKVRNTGSTTWSKSWANPIVLQTRLPDRHASPLATTGWLGTAEPATMLESSVAPNQTATFKVPLAGADYGETSDTFAVARKNAASITGTDLTITRSVRPEYQGQVIGLADPIKVEGGKDALVEVRIKNTGATTWVNSGENAAAINLVQPKGRDSLLRDGSWPLPYRPALMSTSSVAPDQEGLFKIVLAVPPATAEYNEPMQMVIDHIAFVPGTEFTLHIAANNPYQSELNERPIVLYATPGEQRVVTLNVTNKSTKTWESQGSGLVALELKNKNSSVLHTSAWKSPTRPVALANAVAGGQSTSLSFPIIAPPSAGDYSETYHLVGSGSAPIDGSTFTVRVVVRPALAAKLLTVQNSVSVAVNTTERLDIEIKNIGARTWYANGSSAITVTTNQPLKHDSVFRAGSWVSSFSPSALEPPVVAPDQIARLSIEVAAGSKNGSVSDTFTLLDTTGEPVVGSAFSITRVTTGVPKINASGPTIRVGIYEEPSQAGVHAGSAYDVVDSAGTKLGSAASGQTNVRWSGGTYSMSGAVSGTTTNPVRFVPKGSTILNVATYEDHPAWDPSINDNAFRGVIEMRHTSDSKLYVINELPLEQYLWGLGEASNDTDTYLQVLAIAARTYAEYQRSIGGKHPAQGFDVDNKNDQVYKGYNLEQRNAAFVDAVKASTGKMVTYQGKVVVTPYFSQSDGHTRGFHEVFGGSVKPWLVRVAVPENDGKSLLGHGVGLDASGALARANQGKSVDQILKSFYTGVAITKQY